MQKKIFMGIDMGATKIYAGLATQAGKIIATRKYPTPRNAQPALILKLLAGLIDELRSKNGPKRNRLDGIGIGIPGIIDPQSGRVLITPNMNLSGVPIIQRLKRLCKTPVVADNDVNLGLLGERAFGIAKNTENVVGIFPGTGVGGAVIIDGILVRGAQGAAAEIGHMIVDINGPLCSCGNHGCLEAYIGRWALERDIRLAIKKGKKTIMAKLVKRGERIKSRVILKALKRNDKLTRSILKRASKMLGLACISIQHIFNPELIVLGGGLVEACGDFILPAVKKTLKSDAFFKRLGNSKVVPASLGDDAVMLGAVALAHQNLKKQ